MKIDSTVIQQQYMEWKRKCLLEIADKDTFDMVKKSKLHTKTRNFELTYAFISYHKNLVYTIWFTVKS